MVKESLKKILPVIQAFVEGKTIQRYDLKKDDWYDVSPNANIDFGYDYRIKPESKFRPFKTQEECWEEMHNHPDFGWLTRIDTGEYTQIPAVFSYCILFNSATYNYEKAFEYYTFTDGTPFGIKEEENE